MLLTLVYCPSCKAGFKFPTSVAHRVVIEHLGARRHRNIVAPV